ncbi:hypothetical protein B0H13DRAFT_1875995 [Mycena leptocephala]|nr:hypothetical protein B0H13DRAFT_1875995 [Mycena leptocephala]
MDRIRFPSFGCAPIEGLKTKEGYVCRPSVFSDTGALQSTRPNAAISVHLSGYAWRPSKASFWPGNQKWFEVEPSMKGVDSDHPFALYQAAYWPTILHGPENGREVLPMSRLTGWDDYLSEWLATRTLVDNFRLLVDVGKVKDKGFEDQNPGQFQPPACTKPAHGLPAGTINKYGDRLHYFTYALLRSVSESSPATYQFPLSDLEKLEVQRFADKLNKKAPTGGDAAARFQAQQLNLLYPPSACSG